jgi:hypothetical protein
MKLALSLILISCLSLNALSQVGISTNPVFVPTEDLDVDGTVKVREDLILPELAPLAGKKILVVKSSGTVDTASAWNYATSSYGTGSQLCQPNSTKAVIPGLAKTLTLLAPSYVTISTDGNLVNSTCSQGMYSITDIVINVNGDLLEGGGVRRVMAMNWTQVAAIASWSASGSILLPAGTHTFTVSAMGGAGTTAALISSNGITTSSYSLSEGFANGIAAPAGWAFTAIGGTYTSTGNVGQAAPSIMMDATGDRITTPIYSGQVSALSLWIKGLTTNAGSALLVEGTTNGTTWTTIQNITNGLPSSGIVITYNSTTSPSLPAGMIQFRFTYTKSSGNLAIDDVTVTTAQSANYNVNQGQMTLQILSR